MEFRNDSEEGRIVIALCEERDQLRARLREVERERDEARAALSGRTVSCVCGAEAERDRMRAVVEAARPVCRLAPTPDSQHARATHITLAVSDLRAALAALDAER